jgi:ferredoxin-thioredoxin reductase catalytic subunit
MSGIEKSPEVGDTEVEVLFERLDAEAEKSGYHLNPDRDFTLGLVRGLLVNDKRYGYWLCPCRLGEGEKREDLDIICPCDYRDPDLTEYGCCLCALYVTRDVLEGKAKTRRIPERRPVRERRLQFMEKTVGGGLGAGSLAYPVWRCRVCGYLCARDGPPEVCPVCRAKKERFERFL